MNKFATNAKKSDNTNMDMPDIILAAERGDVKTIETALSLGEDINIQEAATGITPLHAAIAGGHLPAVMYLIADENIDFDIQDKFGRSAIGLALLLPDSEIVEQLRLAQLKTNEPKDGESSVVNFPNRDL